MNEGSPIPMLDLKGQHVPFRSEILTALDRLLREGNFILGAAVERFEEEIARYLGVKHAIGVSSGTDAIYLALDAAGVGPGDEVITPAFSFFAIVEAIEKTGAKTVFVDVDAATLSIDPEKVRGALSPATKAIVPVHLYGYPAPMAELAKIADGRGIAVIEDAAQAIGAAVGGTRCGALGDAAAFSFYPTKNLGACGDGGLVTTGDDAFAGIVRSLRDHGQTGKYEHGRFGWNCRLDAFQAAILSIKLKYLDRWNGARRRIASLYRERLGPLDIGLPPGEEEGVTPVFHLFTIRVRRRDRLREHLAAEGIASAIHYPKCLHQQGACVDAGLGGSYPVAEQACAEVLSLPIDPAMGEDDAIRVAEGVESWCEANGYAEYRRRKSR